MHSTDIADFTDMLDAVSAMLSRGKYAPNATSTSMFFNAMRRYSLAIVRAAFDAHVADPVRGKFVPVPADLIAQIEGMLADDGRLGPEEAWALALRARNEAETVVWTPEISQAFASARSVLDGGDDVGARMAFREAYTRIVAAARADMAPVLWVPTLGYDLERRELALAEAIAAGRLQASGDPECGFAGEPLQLAAPRAAMLLLGDDSAVAEQGGVPAPPAARAALRELRERLAARELGPSADALARAATAAAQAETRGKWLSVDDTVALVAEVRANPELLADMQRRAAVQHLPRGAR